MISLTPRQAETLTFLRAHLAKHGISPSFEEICVGVGIKSKGRISELLNGLEQRGAIRRLPNRNRAIEIVEDQGAEFHLRAILDAMKTFGCVVASDPVVVAARQFIGARP